MKLYENHGESSMKKNFVTVDTDMSDIGKQCLTLSSLPHTWLIDIDGTLAVHNGYLSAGRDIPLESSIKFLHDIPTEDFVILLTSRAEKYREQTESFLKENSIRYDRILFGLPVGERVLLNDDKPSGLCMSHAVRLQRNVGIDLEWTVDEDL